jgi:hypothetical protein
MDPELFDCEQMKIEIIYDDLKGEKERRIFENPARIRFGRAGENDVVFNQPAHRSVSSLHAEIAVTGTRIVIEDKGSTNGLFVNGEKVSSAELRGGEEVGLGPAGPSFSVVVTGLPQDAAPGGPAAKTVAMPEVPKKKYGERTVGMMIEKALVHAGLIKRPGTSKSTEYFEAMVESRIKRTSSRVRRALVAVVVLLVLGGIGIGAYVYLNRSVQYFQTTQVNYGDATGSAIAAANRFTIFLLAGKARETGGVQGFCTAFAIGDDLLATNAHCVKTGLEKYTELMVLMNGAPTNRYDIKRMIPHPGYQEGRISPDVGLVQLQGRLVHKVTIAPAPELSKVAPGVPMFLYGFPGRLNRVDAPEATFVRGEIGRVTTFDQKLGDFGQNTLLQHSAFSSAGTSGSPMFNAEGRVIGINAGGYMEDGQVLSGYNFGVRIDLVYALIPMLKTR